MMSLSTMMMNSEKEEQEEGTSPFDRLPDHILPLIPQRLCISDYQVFRQVCLKWRALVETGIATKTCSPAPQLPWLLLRRAYDSLNVFCIENQFSCVRDAKFFPSINVYDYPPVPQNPKDESFTGPIVIPSASLACIGSIGPWLIVADYQPSQSDNISLNPIVKFFLNPVTRARVMLPSQSTLNRCHTTLLFKKIVASSLPTEQGCLVVGIVLPASLAFCRPNDTSWTCIDSGLDDPRFIDIEIFDGKLYAITQLGFKVCIDSGLDGPRFIDIEIFDGKLYAITQLRFKVFLMVFDMSSANVTRTITVMPAQGSEWQYPCLAKDSESKELYMVCRQWNINEGFKVYKFDRQRGINWEMVTDLGDRMLFLSDKSNMVINDKKLGKNCIYFAFTSKGGWNGGFGVYSLKDGSITQLSAVPEDSTEPGASSQTLWFTPSPY